MTPRARLTVAGLVTVAGAALAAAGTTARWFSVVQEGRTLEVPGFGRADFPSSIFAATGAHVGGAAPGLALIMLLAALLAFLAGRLGRRMLMAFVAAGAVAVIVLAILAGPDDARRAAPADQITAADPTITRGPGIPMTVAGGVIALGGALAVLPAAGRVGKVPMPEGVPGRNGAPGRNDAPGRNGAPS